MFALCVTLPSRSSETLLIDAALAVPMLKLAPCATDAGALLMTGRAASVPEPSVLNRYGGEKISAFWAK